MLVEAEANYEKILAEMSQLGEDCWESLAPLLITTDHLLAPLETTQKSFRRLHFLSFELIGLCENLELDEAQRFEKLLQFFFRDKNFIFQDSNLTSPSNLSLSQALIQYTAHPFIGTLLFLHLAHSLQIPVFWVQSKNRYLLKWFRSGRSEYIDLICGGKSLTDKEVLEALNCPDQPTECWSPKELYINFLDLVTTQLEGTPNSKALLMAYNLSIQLDQRNTHLLGRRAFLRHRLGYLKEAHSDLKRYFSFVDHDSAPSEIQNLYQQVLQSVEQSTLVPNGPGPVYH